MRSYTKPTGLDTRSIGPHSEQLRGPEVILCAGCGHRLAHCRNNLMVAVTEPDYRAGAMITIQCPVCDVLNQIRFRS
jgi:hypothetical protein